MKLTTTIPPIPLDGIVYVRAIEEVKKFREGSRQRLLAGRKL